MYKAILLLLLSSIVAAQNTSQPSNGQPNTAVADQLSNHHVLLVPPGPPGSGVAMWIAIGPGGNLAILPVSQLSQKMSEGYRPFTFGELRENVMALISANAALDSEVKTLRAAGQPTSPSEKTDKVLTEKTAEELAQAERARAEQSRIDAARAAAERQQQLKLERARMLYNLLMMQGARSAYQVPAPPPPRPQVNCISRTVGTTVYTDCN
jgi:hypothetical protein